MLMICNPSQHCLHIYRGQMCKTLISWGRISGMIGRIDCILGPFPVTAHHGLLSTLPISKDSSEDRHCIGFIR